MKKEEKKKKKNTQTMRSVDGKRDKKTKSEGMNERKEPGPRM